MLAEYLIKKALSTEDSSVTELGIPSQATATDFAAAAKALKLAERERNLVKYLREVNGIKPYPQLDKLNMPTEYDHDALYKKDWQHPDLNFGDGVWYNLGAQSSGAERSKIQDLSTDLYWSSTRPGEFDIDSVAGPVLTDDGGVAYRNISTPSAVSQMYGVDLGTANRIIELANKARSTDPGFSPIPESVRWSEDPNIFDRLNSQLQAVANHVASKDEYKGRFSKLKEDVQKRGLLGLVSPEDVNAVQNEAPNVKNKGRYRPGNISLGGYNMPVWKRNVPAAMYLDLLDTGNSNTVIYTPKQEIMPLQSRHSYLNDGILPGHVTSDIGSVNGLYHPYTNVHTENLITKNSLPSHEFEHGIMMRPRTSVADGVDNTPYPSESSVNGLKELFDTGRHTRTYKPNGAPSNYANSSHAEALQAAAAGKHTAAHLFKSNHGRLPSSDSEWEDAYNRLINASAPVSFEHGRLINYFTPGVDSLQKSKDYILNQYRNSMQNFKNKMLQKNKSGYSLNDMIVKNINNNRLDKSAHCQLAVSDYLVKKVTANKLNYWLASKFN